MFTPPQSPQQAQLNIQAQLAALRTSLQNVADLHAWAAGVAASDLAAAWSIPLADANTYLSAIADANALNDIYKTGLPANSYPQPASAYVYGASQQQVIATV